MPVSICTSVQIVVKSYNQMRVNVVYFVPMLTPNALRSSLKVKITSMHKARMVHLGKKPLRLWKICGRGLY
jgi:hypothetical protein